MRYTDDASAVRLKARAVVLAAILHLLAALALVRAFAPDLATRAVDRVVATFAIDPPAPPSPAPQPSPTAQPKEAQARGAAGAAGRKAEPRAVAVPPPRIVVAPPSAAPPLAGAGSANSSGAREAGNGTGASGAGAGPGSGGSGTGTGDGGGSRAVKIAGDINSAKDYPIASREQRIGDQVIIALTVDTAGRPSACRVVRPSRDGAADAITCRLALARFRFRPATNAAGEPVVSTFGWQQRWFYRTAP